MSGEEKINQLMMHAMGNVIDKSLQHAAAFDDLDENDAVMTMVMRIMETNTPKILLATEVAMLAIRWHRSRQTEALVNNPAPGQ